MRRVTPRSIAELEQVVAWAVAEEKPLEVLGAGSKRGFGRPVDADLELVTSELAGIDMYEPAELVMSAGAGTPLAEIEAALAGKNQMLAFEPADYGAITGGEAARQTIGGVFAANVSGPRRIAAGAARDHLLGLQLVTGHGQIVKTGGRVVKNVTGYDLCKLLTGSFGTLAVMSHLTFKVLPAPETSGTLLVARADEASAIEVACRAMGTAFDVSAAAVLPPEAAARSTVEAVRGAGRTLAALRLEGPAPSVAYRLRALRAALGEAEAVECSSLEGDASRLIWREIRDLSLLGEAKGPLWRLSVAPTAAAGMVDRLAEFASERLYDWSGGLVWLRPSTDAGAGEQDVRSAVAQVGGHATLVRGDADARRAAPFQPQPPALRALTGRVKRSFDPKAVLNPGRMYAGI